MVYGSSRRIVPVAVANYRLEIAAELFSRSIGMHYFGKLDSRFGHYLACDVLCFDYLWVARIPRNNVLDPVYGPWPASPNQNLRAVKGRDLSKNGALVGLLSMIDAEWMVTGDWLNLYCTS